MNDEKKIGGWIKANSSITKVAEDLGVSRPTVYKYIESYDGGRRDSLPPNVRDYFDERLNSGFSSSQLDVVADLRDEIADLKEQTAESSDELMDVSKILAKLSVELDRAKEIGDSKAVSDIKKIIDTHMQRRNHLEVTISNNLATIEQLSKRLAEAEGLKVIADPLIDPKHGIQSKCFFENGKCMVIHNGPLYENRYYELLLYSKVGYEYVLLGAYRPAKKRHFFIIDDVVFTAPLYYTVTGYDWDPVGDVVDEEDPNMRYVARKELMTGMCELK